MALSAIVERELRVLARRRWTYQARAAAALTAIVLGVILYFEKQGIASSYTGHALFLALAWIGFFLCLLSGPLYTADAMSREWREGTLGLLLLTPLRGVEIALGKVFASGLQAACALGATVPVFAASLPLGGVALGECLRVCLALGCTLFFSLSLGIYLSCRAEGDRGAAWTTAGWVLFFSVLPSLIGLMAFTGGPGGLHRLPAMDGHPLPAKMLIYTGPGFPFIMAFDAAYLRAASWYWNSLAYNVMLGLLLILGAGLKTPGLVLRSRLPRTTGRLGRPRLTFRAWRLRTFRARGPLLDRNPFIWFVTRNGISLFLFWMAVVLALLSVKQWGGYQGEDLALVWMIPAWILKIWIAMEAGTHLAAARQNGLLEAVLVTPLTPDKILAGHLLALRWRLAPALVAWAVLAAGCLYVSLDAGSQFFIHFVLLIHCLADLLALTWWGMWRSLRSGQSSRAAGSAVFVVLVVPWILLGICVALASYLPALNAWFQKLDWWNVPLWALCRIVLDVGLVFYARSRLRKQFRTIVTRAA